MVLKPCFSSMSAARAALPPRFQAVMMSLSFGISESLFQLAVQPGRSRLVLNLEAVQKLSSRMVGTFVSLHRLLRSSGGQLVLCRVDRKVSEIFTVFKMPHLLRICREEQEALQAF